MLIHEKRRVIRIKEEVLLAYAPLNKQDVKCLSDEMRALRRMLMFKKKS